MTISDEQLAEWEALVPRLNDDSYEHMDVAQSADMRPEHTTNYRHAKNAHEAAYAIHSLIADLREARAKLAKAENRANLISNNLKFERELHAKTEAELEGKIEFQNNELVEKQKYILSLERNLWGAELRNAQILSVAEKMRCAGGAQEFQYWFDELKWFLLRKQDTSALDTAIDAATAAQEKP